MQPPARPPNLRDRPALATVLGFVLGLMPALSPVLAAPPAASAAEVPADAARVVAFWREAGPAKWFAKDPAFDTSFRETFAQDHALAAAGKLDHWAETPQGALALLILLDQYPRNSFRETPRMFATDAHARAIARQATAAGFHRKVERPLATFFILPFGHSEALPDQETSVRLARELGEPDWSAAERHRGIIYRFGRFPHRNAILGRESTPEEAAYLENGGYRG